VIKMGIILSWVMEICLTRSIKGVTLSPKNLISQISRSGIKFSKEASASLIDSKAITFAPYSSSKSVQRYRLSASLSTTRMLTPLIDLHLEVANPASTGCCFCCDEDRNSKDLPCHTQVVKADISDNSGCIASKACWPHTWRSQVLEQQGQTS
jgi:hypothetical protein